jgi:hypothetical protein
MKTFKDVMKDILYWAKRAIMFIWQLPQNIIAIMFLLVIKDKDFVSVQTKDDVNFYKIKNFDSGVSFGSLVFINAENSDPRTIRHEYGHSLQSRMLGPLYLIVVGLPSLTMNIICRIKGWDSEYSKNYYNRFPENWADKLGNVTR